MARRLQVRYLPAAEKDLLSIYDWIAAENPERAASFIEELDRTISRLAVHPLMGTVPKHSGLKQAGYRVLIVGAYLVFYKLHRNRIQVFRVVHGSRNLEAII